ncbi:hypothetical protein J6590_068793 [Homalodisca vitripennis]|nr:hypothetical protein J6590_068793 [Homalodisca vitripennis]
MIPAIAQRKTPQSTRLRWAGHVRPPWRRQTFTPAFAFVSSFFTYSTRISIADLWSLHFRELYAPIIVVLLGSIMRSHQWSIAATPHARGRRSYRMSISSGRNDARENAAQYFLVANGLLPHHMRHLPYFMNYERKPTTPNQTRQLRKSVLFRGTEIELLHLLLQFSLLTYRRNPPARASEGRGARLVTGRAVGQDAFQINNSATVRVAKYP